jgi:hypothetical protein
MIVPSFTFDDEANAYLSEDITLDEQAMAHVELASRAPVVVQKKETDGGYANFGMTPESGDRFNINITCNRESIIRLATPVEVTKCYILN